MNSSDSGRPLRDAPLRLAPQRRSGTASCRGRVRSSVTDSASARCKQQRVLERARHAGRAARQAPARRASSRSVRGEGRRIGPRCPPARRPSARGCGAAARAPRSAPRDRPVPATPRRRSTSPASCDIASRAIAVTAGRRRDWQPAVGEPRHAAPLVGREHRPPVAAQPGPRELGQVCRQPLRRARVVTRPQDGLGRRGTATPRNAGDRRKSRRRTGSRAGLGAVRRSRTLRRGDSGTDLIHPRQPSNPGSSRGGPRHAPEPFGHSIQPRHRAPRTHAMASTGNEVDGQPLSSSVPANIPQTTRRDRQNSDTLHRKAWGLPVILSGEEG